MNLPTTSEGILQEFWSTPEGQAVAEMQWELHKDDAISIMEAAWVLDLPRTTNSVAFIETHFTLYRKPNSQMKSRRPQSRKVTTGSRRAWYVLRSDVLAFMAK